MIGMNEDSSWFMKIKLWLFHEGSLESRRWVAGSHTWLHFTHFCNILVTFWSHFWSSLVPGRGRWKNWGSAGRTPCHAQKLSTPADRNIPRPCRHTFPEDRVSNFRTPDLTRGGSSWATLNQLSRRSESSFHWPDFTNLLSFYSLERILVGWSVITSSLILAYRLISLH